MSGTRPPRDFDLLVAGELNPDIVVAGGSVEPSFGQVAKKPKSRDATHNGIKGSSMEASVVTKGGMPQQWMAFAGKLKQDVVFVVVPRPDGRKHHPAFERLDDRPCGRRGLAA